jgi:hypothetical protein
MWLSGAARHAYPRTKVFFYQRTEQFPKLISAHSKRAHPSADAEKTWDANNGSNAALPTSESGLIAWMRTLLQPPDGWPQPLLDLNFAHPYIPDAGFHVAVDGALRLRRMLPAAALFSVSPPAAFYQDNPIRDDVKVRTFSFDRNQHLLFDCCHKLVS